MYSINCVLAEGLNIKTAGLSGYIIENEEIWKLVQQVMAVSRRKNKGFPIFLMLYFRLKTIPIHVKDT